MAHQPHDLPAVHAAAHGGHASVDDEYAVTPPGSGYEHTDANTWIIVKFGLWLAVSAIVIHIGLWFAFGLMVEWRQTEVAEYPLAAGQEPRRPAGARLQPIPANDIYVFRLQEESILQNYRWIDRDGGRVQIPIREAMRLTVERGLPARAGQPPDAGAAPQTAAAGTPAAAPPGYMPSDSSSGRTLERRH